jgi:predicted O-methyltransferase YrrM
MADFSEAELALLARINDGPADAAPAAVAAAPAAAKIPLRRVLAGAHKRVSRLSGVPYLHGLEFLHVSRGVTRYLEVGTQWGLSLRLAKGRSVAIDPKFLFNRLAPWAVAADLHLFETTSDDYFAGSDPREVLGGPIQMAFIDGMHLADFVLRDFANIEPFCAPDGIIVLHDAIPMNFEMAGRAKRAEAREDKALADCWTGDVWRVGPILRRERPDLTIEAFDCPATGLVVISQLDPGNRSFAPKLPEITRALIEQPAAEAEFWTYIETLPVQDSRLAFALRG